MTISQKWRSASYDDETDEVVVWLLTMTHSTFAAPIRLSSHAGQRISEDPLEYVTMSRGNQYLWAPFSIKLAQERDGVPLSVKLSITDYNSDIYAILRTIYDSVIVKIEAVLASSPDLVEITIPKMRIGNVGRVFSGELVAKLYIKSYETEPMPSGVITQATNPALA
jgi:hypothetical protein